MESGRATAIAHPIQGLVKYHGLRDFERRIPYHSSISVCTAPTHTKTTVTLLDGGADDEAIINEVPVDGRPLQRIRTILDEVRRQSDDHRAARVVSTNDFPERIGLGSSASGFAALAKAAVAAYGLDLDGPHISAIARLGAGSAARSVTGWFSEWAPPPKGRPAAESMSKKLLGAEKIDLRIVVPVIRSDEPTEGVHREVLSSPFFEARLKYVEDALVRMRVAVTTGDIREIGLVAERDTLNLHAITMTSDAMRLTWRPETLRVMHEVRRLRKEEDLGCWFSIDTGATPYINTVPEHEERVAKAMAELPGIDEVLRLSVGRDAYLVDAHLA